MKIPQLVLIVCLAFTGEAVANDAPPTEASIRELLEITEAHKLLDNMRGQVDGMIKSTMQDQLRGVEATPAKQAILDDMRTKMLAVMDESLNWDAMLPLYIKTYQESFTQTELDGITRFYKTPAGKAYVKKMPVVMQNMMGQVQGLIKPMQQKLGQIQHDASQRIKALPADQPAPANQPAPADQPAPLK